MTQPFRAAARLPVEAVTTYQISAPPSTHFRAAACADVDCANMAHGWRTILDETTDLGARQAAYIRRDSGRAFTEAHDEAGLTVFTFQSGQTCFGTHRVSLEREPLYIVRGGDWRGNPRQEMRQHSRAVDWVEDFGEHQQTLADRAERG